MCSFKNRALVCQFDSIYCHFNWFLSLCEGVMRWYFLHLIFYQVNASNLLGRFRLNAFDGIYKYCVNRCQRLWQLVWYRYVRRNLYWFRTTELIEMPFKDIMTDVSLHSALESFKIVKVESSWKVTRQLTHPHASRQVISVFWSIFWINSTRSDVWYSFFLILRNFSKI